MNKHIENIIIGKPIVSEDSIFGLDDNPDVFEKEKEKMIWTEERNLPKILGGEFEASFIENGELKKEIISLKIAPSSAEVKRNRKDLIVILDKLDYIELKYGKKKLFILVGN